jgi:hypothetical protein
MTMQTKTIIEHPLDRSDELKARKDRIRLLDIPPHRFVMIDGSGPPLPEAFQARMPGLYGTAYGLRFALKARGVDEHVGVLESLFWSVDGGDLGASDPGDWRWTLMIWLPPEASRDELDAQLAIARSRLDPSIEAGLRTEVFAEGPVAQIMHIGPYSEEQATIERMHQLIEAAGYRPVGRHHELYLGDPRRTAPERLRTIIRTPVV